MGCGDNVFKIKSMVYGAIDGWARDGYPDTQIPRYPDT